MLVLLAGLLGAGVFTGSAWAAGCDEYASPSGSDSSNGSISSPYLTVDKLDQSLAPGQTGCLRAGTYGNTSTWDDLANSGTSGNPITIMSYPGETAHVDGYVDIEGDYTTLTGLTIDGSNTLYSNPTGPCGNMVASDPLTIEGQNDIFEYNDFTQSIPSTRGVAIGIGFWGGASAGNNAIVRYNKIHDVGACQAYDHLIYLSHGNNVQIYDNWMWNDPNGWGVQVYPAATNANIYNNVIDAAGSGFVIGGSSTVSGNTIDHNVVMNSTGLVNAATTGAAITTCCGLGTGNTFDTNDSYNNPAGIGTAVTGLTFANNITTNPDLIDPANHDYAPAPGSPVAGWGLWNGNPAGSTTTPPTQPPLQTVHRTVRQPSGHLAISGIETQHRIFTFDLTISGRGTLAVRETAQPDNVATSASLRADTSHEFTFASKNLTAKRAGTIRVTVTPDAQGRRLTNRDLSKIAIKLSVSYTPVGGALRNVSRGDLRITA
jgi:hypothetical protein